MAMFQLDDVFTYQDANDIKRLWASDDPPQAGSEGDGEVWLDTSMTPNQLKRFNNGSWEMIGAMTAADILTALKDIDGHTSGLDADTVDGVEGADLVRSDADSTVTADTQWQDGKKIKLGSASDAEFYSDGSDVFLQLNSGAGDLVFKLEGATRVAEIRGAMSGSAGSYTGHPTLRLRQTVDQAAYNTGDTHGEIQFYTDDSGGNFPGLQGFVKTISCRGTGITNPDTALSFGTSLGSYTAVETMRLDGYGNLNLYKDQSLTVGESGDLKLTHDGSNSYLSNEVDNGADLTIRNKSHGNQIKMSCEDSSGVEKTLLSIEAEKSIVRAQASLVSEIFDGTLAVGEVLVTDIPHKSTGILMINVVGAEEQGALIGLATSTYNSVTLIPGCFPPTFSTTEDTSLKVNVYFGAGAKIYVQNNRSFPGDFKIGFIGCRHGNT